MVMLEVRGGVADVCPRILAPRFLLLVQVVVLVMGWIRDFVVGMAATWC